MKKLLILCVAIILTSCAENKELELNGKMKTFEYYGLMDKDEIKNDSINYEVSAGSIGMAIIFSQTFIAPFYVIGWNLYEPKTVKVEYRRTVPVVTKHPQLKGDTLEL